jgi:hypothetical protein
LFKQKCKRTERALECLFNKEVQEVDEELTKPHAEEIKEFETPDEELIIDETFKDQPKLEVFVEDDLIQSDASLLDEPEMTVDGVVNYYDEMTTESVEEETEQVELIKVQPSEDEDLESSQVDMESDISRLDCIKLKSSDVVLQSKKSFSNNTDLAMDEPHTENSKRSQFNINPMKSEQNVSPNESSVLEVNQSFEDESTIQTRELTSDVYPDNEPDPEAIYEATTSDSKPQVSTL